MRHGECSKFSPVAPAKGNGGYGATLRVVVDDNNNSVAVVAKGQVKRNLRVECEGMRKRTLPAAYGRTEFKCRSPKCDNSNGKNVIRNGGGEGQSAKCRVINGGLDGKWRMRGETSWDFLAERLWRK